MLPVEYPGEWCPLLSRRLIPEFFVGAGVKQTLKLVPISDQNLWFSWSKTLFQNLAENRYPIQTHKISLGH